MSFVGPRPLLPIDQPKRSQLRLQMRPGVTGWAQINGGREITPEEKGVLDEWYVRNASVWLDIRIILRTVGTVLFGDRYRSHTSRNQWKLTDLMAKTGCPRWLRLRAREAHRGKARNRLTV